MRSGIACYGATLAILLSGAGATLESAEFRIRPYVQNPAPDAMTIRWLSNSAAPGRVQVQGATRPISLMSTPVRAEALAYNPWKEEPGSPHPDLPWLHSVRVTGLQSGKHYDYTVSAGEEEYSARFCTTPSRDTAIRFMAYSDSETEPESTTSPPVDWPRSSKSQRPEGISRYLVNQTVGYQENNKVILSRKPNFLLVTGDLVETGGEQRDWDEFWRHNAGDYGSVASFIPILPAIGNHENFAGPGGGYSAEGANFGVEKFRTYFEVPDNSAANPKQRGRYYRIDYGPITLITVDSSDGSPHKTAADTNHNLDGSHAPDFNPGSEQYQWLEAQLADAQAKSRFTFVQFHHTMYGSGPHSVPFGHPNFSGQSGIAMRVLEPLFFKYGVDIVFSGHDELLERSHKEGTEILPSGKTRPHGIHFYDVGFGGDGLRGPSEGFDNPNRQFFAHDDAVEVWENGRLISGGKHYGHLEVNVAPGPQGIWQTTVNIVHVFPVIDQAGAVSAWERRLYDDIVTVEEK